MGFLVLSCPGLLAQERWVYRYDGSASGPDEAHSIVAGLDGNLYSAGYSAGSGTDHDFTVISLSPDVGVEEKPEPGSRMAAWPERSRGQARLQLSVSPTPALGSVNIHYCLPRAAEVRLAVYDASGSRVATLVEGKLGAGAHKVRWETDNIPAGIYFCRLRTVNLTATRRLVVFK